METKYTPAPWGSFDKNLPDAATDFPCVVITAPNGCPLAYVGNHAGYEANARLIAAAPDLLEALENMLRPPANYGCGIDHAPEQEMAAKVAYARAAITKATTGA